MIKIPHPTKGLQNLGTLGIYDAENQRHPGIAVESRSVSSGFMKFKNISQGRELELRLHGTKENAIRVRKIQFEIIEVLKNNGFSVGRRERDI